jgi:hypothetical protein
MDNQPTPSEQTNVFTVHTPYRTRLAVLVGVFLVLAALAHAWFAGYLPTLGTPTTTPTESVTTEESAVVTEIEPRLSFTSGAVMFDLSSDAAAVADNQASDVATYEQLLDAPAGPTQLVSVPFGKGLVADLFDPSQYPVFNQFLTLAFADLQLVIDELQPQFVGTVLAPSQRSDVVTLTDNSYRYQFPPVPATQAAFLVALVRELDPANATTYETAIAPFQEQLIRDGKALPSDLAAAENLAQQYLSQVTTNAVVEAEWWPQLQAEWSRE